jgi:hypothetical protein
MRVSFICAGARGAAESDEDEESSDFESNVTRFFDAADLLSSDD